MRTLLAVFAHPDDETFGPGGTLATYAAQGVAVHLVCATRGEAGDSDLDDWGECETLACRREQELRCAAAILGIRGLHVLGYRDSGMPGWAANQHPQALIQADPEAVAAQIADIMRRLRPQVVLTFDPYGVYGHPDHIFIHHATRRAYEGLAPDERPPKLYFVAPARVFSRWLVRLMPLFGADPERAGRNRDINLRAVVEHQLPITTVISIRSAYEAKERASACHSSQASGPRSIWGRLPRPLVRRIMGQETFYRAAPPFRPGERLERDLFEGIE